MLTILAASAVLLSGMLYWRREAVRLEASDDVLVSQEDSFCGGDLKLELDTEGGYPIYYTTDGSVPTLESAQYAEPLVYEASGQVQSMVLRACAFDPGTGEWGELFTRTYFYAESEEILKERYSTYIVCVTSDPYNLYDYENGILTEGKIRDEYIASEEYDPQLQTQPANFTQKGREWEREAHIEILTADGQRVIDQDAGIRVFGHASRQSYRKSLKLYAREEYGAAQFDYALFPDNVGGATGSVQQAYERLVIRNNGTDRAVTLFREELFQTLCGQIEGIDSKSVAPAAVYLNGEYYNAEWIQEVYDDLYMEENYGVSGSGYYEIVTVWDDEEEADLSREEQRALADYDALTDYAERDLTDDAVFGEFCSLVDVENMLQYFAIETYIANWDWPQNNIKLYRYYSPGEVYGEDRQDGRWRYLYYDMEAGFNLYNAPEDEWRSIQDVLDGNRLFAAVMERKDMQERFAWYMEQCISDYFTEEKVRSAVEELKAARDQELQANIDYKKSQDETYSLSMESIEENIDVIYDFVQKRPDMIRRQFEELYGITLE
ncbi:MAG: CotH kinase family protein [Eubacteriales bacterium]|nr:CotH kinase family protein [Eubacteriales bacterium]